MANIVGIDLGTTFSALAALNAIGKPEIVPNADGERLTPSAIYFDEENSDIIRVGIEAINSRRLNAERSVRWIKRKSSVYHSLRSINWIFSCPSIRLTIIHPGVIHRSVPNLSSKQDALLINRVVGHHWPLQSIWSSNRCEFCP